MFQTIKNQKTIKFNVKIDLPEISIGKNKGPDFAKLFKPPFINKSLTEYMNITEYKNINQNKRDLNIKAAEEVS